MMFLLEIIRDNIDCCWLPNLCIENEIDKKKLGMTYDIKIENVDLLIFISIENIIDKIVSYDI